MPTDILIYLPRVEQPFAFTLYLSSRLTSHSSRRLNTHHPYGEPLERTLDSSLREYWRPAFDYSQSSVYPHLLSSSFPQKPVIDLTLASPSIVSLCDTRISSDLCGSDHQGLGQFFNKKVKSIKTFAYKLNLILSQ